MSEVSDLNARLTALEAITEARFMELLYRVKRIETIMFGTAGSLIVGMVTIIFKIWQ